MKRIAVIIGSYLAASYVGGLVLTLLAAVPSAIADAVAPFDPRSLASIVVFTPLLAGVAGLWVAVLAFVPMVLAVAVARSFDLRARGWAVGFGGIAGAAPLVFDLRHADAWPQGAAGQSAFVTTLAAAMVAGACAGYVFWRLARTSLWPGAAATAPPVFERS
jgi:hypothetical protein